MTNNNNNNNNNFLQHLKLLLFFYNNCITVGDVVISKCYTIKHLMFSILLSILSIYKMKRESFITLLFCSQFMTYLFELTYLSYTSKRRYENAKNNLIWVFEVKSS